MRLQKICLLFILFSSISITLYGQDTVINKPNFKFGVATLSDFDLSNRKFDSSADAVIISNIGSAKMISHEISNYAIEYVVTKRIKILTENGKKLANHSIKLFRNSKVNKCTAYAHNIRNKKVVTTQMDDNDLYNDKVTESAKKIKFTIPKVEVGSIIEYKYSYVTINFISIRDWHFQSEYPTFWSSFSFSHDRMFIYTVIPQTIIPLVEATSKNSNISASTSQIELRNIVFRKWSMQDIPATIDEPMVYNISNYQSKLFFELGHIQHPIFANKFYQKDWDLFSAYLRKNDNWYRPFLMRYPFFTPLINKRKNESDEQLAERIFYTIRNKFEGKKMLNIVPQKSPKSINKKRKSSATDINLFLMTCYRNFGLRATPLLISTRGNGKPIKDLPIMRRLNYTVCHLRLNGKDILLDASNKHNKYNTLPLFCYNGYAHLIGNKHKTINLSSDSIKELGQTDLIYSLNLENQKIKCKMTEQLGYNTSTRIQKKLDNETVQKFKTKFYQSMSQEATLDSFSFIKNPLDTFLYNISTVWSQEMNIAGDKIYISPLLENEGQELTAALNAKTRQLPLEFPYGSFSAKSSTFILPQGYKIAEYPKSVSIDLSGGRGKFDYLVEVDDGKIIINTITQINKSVFMPSEFNDLKDFYSLMNELKQGTIVLSKL